MYTDSYTHTEYMHSLLHKVLHQNFTCNCFTWLAISFSFSSSTAFNFCICSFSSFKLQSFFGKKKKKELKYKSILRRDRR